jgi:[protein-PII] uridylyltransferase
VQPWLAQQLGYNERGGLRAVERFMKHYFLIAKDVGDLTTILCAALEMQQLKASPDLGRLLRPLTWKARRQIRARTDFRIDNDRLNVASPDVFKRDPVNLIRFFAEARHTNAFLHPDAIRLLRQSLRLIDDKLREDPEANKIFVDLLTSEKGAELSLRRMNEAGVLGRFVPEFGNVVAMTQFNMYHHYTVDEHLVRTVGMLTDIERGGASKELPLSTEIISTVKNRRALFVAAFLHDIGKGQEEDHSIVGARVARKLGPRFGLTAAETETVAWLIEQHLTMSNIAQSRDLADPKTIRDFADVVQSPERLKLLLLLTVADIRAVGPGVWNGWKGQLLRTLFHETEPLVAGGHTKVARSQRIANAQADLREALSDWSPVEVDRLIERHYPDYWLRTDTARQVEHANLLAKAEKDKLPLATETRTDAFTAITDLTIVAPNHPRLLALFAGACAAAGANIAGAHIMTTRDGFALDTFLLNRAFKEDDDEFRRGNRIGSMIGRMLRGDIWLTDLLAERGTPTRRTMVFTVEPEVIINNALSDQFTVIEVTGRDRTGLLYELTSELSNLMLDITSAHITTFGEKAVDVFYVTDLVGKKVTNEGRQQAIQDALERILEGAEGEMRAAMPDITAG